MRAQKGFLGEVEWADGTVIMRLYYGKVSVFIEVIQRNVLIVGGIFREVSRMGSICLKKQSKSGLAIALSAIEGFEDAKVSLEQYMTDSEVGGSILWDAFIRGDIRGKVIVDLGCGTGVLGIGCMLLGAKKVHFVDVDGDVLERCKENVGKVESESSVELHGMDAGDFEEKCEVVLMNPPFGTKSEHSDKKFLEKAFSISPLIYSFHKSETKAFVGRVAEAHGFAVTHVFDFDFPLKASMTFHRRKIHRVKVSCFRLSSVRA